MKKLAFVHSLFLLSIFSTLGTESDSGVTPTLKMATEEERGRHLKIAENLAHSLRLMKVLDKDFEGDVLFEKLLETKPDIAIRVSEIWRLRINSKYQDAVLEELESLIDKHRGADSQELKARYFLRESHLHETITHAYIFEHAREFEQMVKSALN